MAAPTTIHDLPDDMLHEIFGRVFAAEAKDVVAVTQPPYGAHAALRRVCRRWRDIADWVRLSTASVAVDTSALADAGAVRVRHPAALKVLALVCPPGRHTTCTSQAAISLINGSADLRRALVDLTLFTCCLPALSPAVTPIASCTALTKLVLVWNSHRRERVVPSNMLASLSALRLLHTLSYLHGAGNRTALAPLAPLPALPDAPRLTGLSLHMGGNFVPVGSDAALGRLRRLEFEHRAPVQELLDAEDPFLLRAAFDAGTWQPSRLTGLKELAVSFGPVHDSRAPARPSPTGSRSGSEWAPLAGQVTSLTVNIKSVGYRRQSTGIVAGLGVLTALRVLAVVAEFKFYDPPGPGLLEPVSIDRVRAPHLTFLTCDCTSTPVNVARFPDLVSLRLASVTLQPPLNLRSLVARSSLNSLQLGISRLRPPCLINLAELFVGGGGWPVLEYLWLRGMLLEWDETGLAGAPSAAEFAERVRQLLPALAKVEIAEPSGRGALPDRSRVAFVVACRRHVVPALKGLHVGPKRE